MSVPEEKVLVRKDAATDDNPDLWPTFGLRKIQVTSQATGELVSLLSAHKENPLTVIGQLDEPQEEYRKLVRVPDYRNKIIEVKDVKTYAFAEYDDGTYGFWAAGKAGWFEFETTAPSYRRIYKRMNEATSILYFLADRLRKSTKAAPKLSARELKRYVRQCCLDYLALSKDPTRFADIEDVREVFHEHREFLITSMLEGQESLDWNDTPMLNYFKQTFPDEVQRMNFKPQPSTSKQSAAQISKSTTMEEARKRKSTSPPMIEPTAKKPRGRQAKAKDAEPPPSKVAATRSKDVVENSDEELRDSSATTRKRNSMLRPPGSNPAKKTRKTPGRKPKHLQEAESNESSDAEAEAKASMPPPITTLKTGDDLDFVTNPHHKPGSTIGPDDAPTYLPRKYLEISLKEYPILSMTPQGPGDLWTCEFEDCRRRVHEGSTEEGKARIREHMETHIGPHGIDARDKIDLALDESRPYLPVDNLVRRLQALAPEPGKDPAPDSIQRKFSAPIRRRY